MMNSPRVLIVDDDRLILESTAEMLERDFSVIKASSAEEAWENYLAEKPDCIVCDIVMPGISGIDLLKRIRDEGDDLPFVVITGQGTMEYAERCANLRTSGYLKKPLDADLLVDMVTRLTGIGSHKERDKKIEKTLHPKLMEARAWIEKNLSAHFSTSHVSKAIGVSESHLGRLYRTGLRISLTDDANRLRVERAKLLLTSTDAPIDSIREAVGYRTSQHFYKSFKKYTGISPRQFRDSLTEQTCSQK